MAVLPEKMSNLTNNVPKDLSIISNYINYIRTCLEHYAYSENVKGDDARGEIDKLSLMVRELSDRVTAIEEELKSM